MSHGLATSQAATLFAALLAVGCSSSPPAEEPNQITATAPHGSPTADTTASQALPIWRPGSSDTSVSPAPLAIVVAARPACDLLFRNEVGSALGLSIEAADSFETTVDNSAASVSECTFRPHDYDQFAPFVLTFAVGDRYTDDFGALATTASVSTVTGLGDGGLFRLDTIWGVGEPLGVLYVRIGNAILGLTLGIQAIEEDGSLDVVDVDRQQQILVDLARVALGRLTGPPERAAQTCALLTVAEASDLAGLPIVRANDVDAQDEWGPACHYSHGSGVIELYVSVDAHETAAARFTECAQNSEPVLGIGDEAYHNHFCQVPAGTRFMTTTLLARAGDTVLTIGEGGLLPPEDARAVLIAVARFVIARLAYTPI